MTTLNIHAQESKSRFSCLSAADPENIPDVRKNINKIVEHYESTEIKQTAAARPKGGAGFSKLDKHGIWNLNFGPKLVHKS